MLVVGGGVVGLAAAMMCRRAGLGRVQVIERERLACGPSGSAAGGLTPGIHAIARPAAFSSLAAEGLALHRELDASSEGRLGLRSMDWLVVSSDRIAPGSIDVPGVEIVDEETAHAMEPRLGECGSAIAIRRQAWVHPQRLAVELARAAGPVATGVAMTGVETRWGRVVRVETSAGPVSPGALVLATGSVSPDLASVPQTSVKGHLLVTAPVADPPRTALASSVLVLPLPDGRLLAGGTFDVGDDSPVVRDPVVEAIRTEMTRLLPQTGGVGVERAWCCFRPGTPDELPVIDRVPGLENAWMSVGHYRTGLLIGPGAGRAIASWIASSEAPSGMEAFGAMRFG